jgi:membrane protease YdiL (CAAX protease family)
LSGPIKAWVRAHPIGAFCVWFFPVAWAIALLPLVFPRPFGVEVPLEVFLSGATVLGGLLPVVVITRMVDGPEGLDAFRRRLLPARASIGWYVLALLAAPLLALALAVIVYGPPNVTASTMLSALVNGLLLQAVLGFLAVNLWEEATWMGFVQARLQAQRGVLLAAVVTAVLFALQHLPLFVENGLVNAAGLVFLAAFIVVAIPFRALTGWMYNRTGSLFLVGLLHAVGDATTNGSFADGFLPRLYENADVGFFHMFALALIGVLVIATTRARLGLPARPALRAKTGASPATA